MHTATAVSADELVSSSASPAPSAPPAPPPAEEAPQPATAPDPSKEPERGPFAGQRDSLNREFHSAKFRIKDGRPQLDSMKRFVPLGLGGGTKKSAPSALTASAATSSPAGNTRSVIPPDESAPAEEEFVVSEEMAVETAISLVQNALVMIGEEEGTLTEMEIKMLRGPLVRCLKKYEIVGKVMTPELELASVIALLVMRRARKPKTQSWIQSKLLAFRSWWTRRKLARVPLPSPSAEPVHAPAPGAEAAAEYLHRHARAVA